MKKKMSFCIIFVLIATMLSINVSAKVPYDSYTYSTLTGKASPVFSPAPYLPVGTIDTASLGTPMVQPRGTCVDKNGFLYVADAGMNKIFVLNRELALVKVIDEFENNGMLDFFSACEGVYVHTNGDIYICDTNQKRIIILNKDYAFVKEIKDVVPTGTNPDDFIFLPSKLTVDASGNIYVISKNEYSGILKLNSEGKFLSYMGSNKVTYDPITRLWKKIMTQEQSSQLEQFLPIEYTNMQMDKDGFICAVSKSSETAIPIKRLNLSGKDVLIKNGYVGVTGDIMPETESKEEFIPSLFVDITSDENGLIYCLDAINGRVFVYNYEGFLLYTFGGIGKQLGLFTMPTAIELIDNKILIADEGNGKITIFEETPYSSLIRKADECYNNGEYDDSINHWEAVLKKNANFELAYVQIGKIYLRQNKYDEAMKCFERGNFRGDQITSTSGYNKAFIEQRRIMATKLMGIGFIILFIIVILVIVMKICKNRRLKKSSTKANQK